MVRLLKIIIRNSQIIYIIYLIFLVNIPTNLYIIFDKIFISGERMAELSAVNYVEVKKIRRMISFGFMLWDWVLE